jgi:hypothetical protein
MVAAPVTVGLMAALVLNGPARGVVAVETPHAHSGLVEQMTTFGTTATAEREAAASGVFQIKCRPSHTAPDDPIVAPRQRGAAHLHEFFGNVSTDAFTTTATLTSHGTTCADPADKAAYWAPTLYNRGARVEPSLMIAYYRTGQLRNPASIRPYPLGLRMIAGDGHAMKPQPTMVTDWACDGAGPNGTSEPPRTCPNGVLRLRVIFPNCWDGKRLDTADHKSHMAYSYRTMRQCPASHPVALPTLKMHLRYHVSGPLDRLTLSSGSRYTAHADFWNAWNPAALRELVQRCLVATSTCNSPSFRRRG